MKSFLPLIAGVALVASATGCVDERSFYISENRGITAGCVADSVGLAHGTFDVSLEGAAYHMNPVVENDLAATAGTDGQPERNRLQMRRFDAELIVEGGTKISADVAVAGAVDPGGQLIITGMPVITGNDVTALRGTLAKSGQSEIRVDVRLRAIADQNGDELESVEFVFPITVCSGCLVSQPAGCPDPEEADLATNPCGWPQDKPLSCCPGQCFAKD